ncbi:DNA (cytosine-5-)-methyltransferase [Candidatus Pacearchaeota archaeon]|nr:DNA (cytosine-5-)-methyltransferase [Candidatus Pacearchaeota archaeon]
MAKIKIASLFCGCGGTELGIIGGFNFLGKKYFRHNTEIVFANDIEKSACEIYNANFEHESVCADIKKISSIDIPDHDVLIGGFPCQSFSIVAQNPPRLGFKSENGRLFLEMVRILKDKRPKAFIAENVRGLISANNGKAFPLILKEFEKAGYRVDYKLVDASGFGVPQRRQRVVIIGYRNDLNISPSFPEPSNNNPVPLKKVIFDHKDVDERYYFSERAIEGLQKSNKSMNKGRSQNIEEPCATVTSHLAKVSLNSTDPVLKIGEKYRRFTPREVARIQSFPESFKLIGSDFQKYKALGNAIPPVLFWHIMKEVSEKLLELKESNLVAPNMTELLTIITADKSTPLLNC